MSYWINNGFLIGEYLAEQSKPLIAGVINFKATLISGSTTIVNIVGDDNVVYGTFTLDTLNVHVYSGMLTNLYSAGLRWVRVSGTGQFTIQMIPGI